MSLSAETLKVLNAGLCNVVLEEKTKCLKHKPFVRTQHKHSRDEHFKQKGPEH